MTCRQSSLIICTSDTSYVSSEMSSNNLRGSVTNSFVHHLSSDVVQTEFSDRTTSCIGYDVVIAQRYSVMCTYTLDDSCFLWRSCASYGVSRRLHLNLHESVHVLCEKPSIAYGLIVHRRLIIVPRFVDFYDDVPDDHCFLQLDRDPHTRDTMFAMRMTTDAAVGRLCTSSTQYKH